MKRRRSLKDRIFAITAMLLVSAIVLGTTSYAWIVMSTRPEAGKISTTVGANGSLEIALATPEHMKELIANNMNVVDGYSGFSTGDALVDNTLWGNLLDLSDRAYGLSSLIMKPTALNVENNILKYAPIITAMYGTDGRITFLTDYSASAGYDPDSLSFLVSENIPYGVRVAGLTADAALRAEIYGLVERILYGEEYDEEDWEHDNVEDFLINCTDLILV